MTRLRGRGIGANVTARCMWRDIRRKAVGGGVVRTGVQNFTACSKGIKVFVANNIGNQVVVNFFQYRLTITKGERSAWKLK